MKKKISLSEELVEIHDHEVREAQVEEQHDEADEAKEKENILRAKEDAKTKRDARTIGRRALR